LIRLLGLTGDEEIRRYILQMLDKADEVHYDAERDDVRYFLHKVDDKFLCVITVGMEVVTSYLISGSRRRRYKERRWR